MAKNIKSDADAYQEMLDLLSPEEREMLLKLTGQNNGGGGTKTPVVKINYKERADSKGVKIPKGNFVLGQSNVVKDGKKVLEHAGTDLGASFSCVILKVGTQYSYWSDDAKKRCSSQIICDRDEIPVGFNLKNRCNDKSCPRRKDGIDKADRCPSQYVVYLRLPAGTKLPDGTDCPIAMMYVKGTSYKGFQDYINETLKGIPTIAVSTILGTDEQEQGATLFYQLTCAKGDPVPASVFQENFKLVSGVNKQLLEYKEEQKKKIEADRPKSEGNTSVVPDAVIVNDSDDDVAW